MNRQLFVYAVLASALVLTINPTTATACGEASLNAGKGLPYQGYLAPRPATILVYSTPDPTTTDADRHAIYDGLTRAGHKVTVVSDTSALASALREKHFDVVITAFDAVDTVATATADAGGAFGKPTLLPVVSAHDRSSSQLQGHYNAFLTDGAGLGQYLKMIGKALPANAL